MKIQLITTIDSINNGLMGELKSAIYEEPIKPLWDYPYEIVKDLIFNDKNGENNDNKKHIIIMGYNTYVSLNGISGFGFQNMVNKDNIFIYIPMNFNPERTRPGNLNKEGVSFNIIAEHILKDKEKSGLQNINILNIGDYYWNHFSFEYLWLHIINTKTFWKGVITEYQKQGFMEIPNKEDIEKYGYMNNNMEITILGGRKIFQKLDLLKESSIKLVNKIHFIQMNHFENEKEVDRNIIHYEQMIFPNFKSVIKKYNKLNKINIIKNY